MTLKEMLIFHEGYKAHPYSDSVGKLTIGVGRNLTDNGLRTTEIHFLLDNDIAEVVIDLRTLPVLNYVEKYHPARWRALCDMRFNLGPVKFRQFKRMLEAISNGDWDRAAACMKQSKWYHQVGRRGPDLVEMVRTGEEMEI